MERTELNRLAETAVRTVCVRALKGKTTVQRDIYKALHMNRYYPEQEAILREIMFAVLCSRYVQDAGRNRSGWGIVTATRAGIDFYKPLVEDGTFALRRRRPAKKSADAAFLDDLFKDTKF